MFRVPIGELLHKLVFGVVAVLCICGLNLAARAQTVVATIPTGRQPNAVAVNPVTNKIYVGNQSIFGPSVTVIDGASNSVINVPLESRPNSIAVNPITNKIYVAHLTARVTVIDGATNTATTLPTGADLQSAVAVNPVANKVYVSNYFNASVTVIDGATNSIARVPTPAFPRWLAVNPATNRIYIAHDFPGNVTVIDGATNTTTTIAAPGSFSSIAVNAVSNKIYVADVYSADNDKVIVIDGATNATTSVTVGSDPYAFAVNPVTNKVYVANYGGSVTVIDGATNSTTTVVVPGAGWRMAVNAVTNKVYVAHVAVPGLTSKVSIIDGVSNSATTLETGTNLQNLAVNPVTNKAYVSDYGGNAIIVIDGAAYSTATVPTGMGPGKPDVNPVTNKVYVSGQGPPHLTVIDGPTDFFTAPALNVIGALSVAVNPITNKIYLGHFFRAVTVIDGATYSSTTLPFDDGNVEYLAVNPVTNKIYVPTASRMRVIDGATDAVTEVPLFGGRPLGIALNPVTNKIYASDNDRNRVIALDGATNSVTAVPVGANPYGVDVNPVTNKIYVANSGSNNVTVIDGVTGSTATVPAGTGPADLAVNPITNRIYVANELSNNVTVIDGATNSTTTVGTGLAPRGVAVNPVTNKIYVGSVQSSAVTVIDGATNTAIPVTTGVGPWFIAVNPVTNKAYASNYGPGGGGTSVTVISESQTQPSPLTVTISPLPNNVATSATPSFTFTPTSTFGPNTPAVQDVLYQVDTWQGSWTSSAPSFSGTTGPLQPGMHTLYAFAVDAQAATSTQAGSPLVGRIAAYSFLVNPAANLTAMGGTPQSATVNTAFGTTFQAKVTDAFNQLLSGVPVTFSAPASGAGGTFAVSAVVTTNATGLAAAPIFTANAIAGTYSVSATAPGVATPAVFTLTNLPLSQSITFAALGARIYGGAFSLNATATSGLAVMFTSSTPTVCVVSGTTVSLLGVGTCSIIASQPGNATYTSAPNVIQSFVVNRAALVVAAQDATKAFGAPLPPLQAAISGFVNGDTSAVLTGTATATTTATASSPVGTYPITIDAGTLAAANYTFNFPGATLTIVRAASSLTITGLVPGPTAPPGQAFTVTFTVGGAAGATAPSGSLTYSVDAGTPQTAPVTAGIATVMLAGLATGTHTVSASYSGDGNYLASGSQTFTLTVGKVAALLSLAASPATTLPIGQSFTIAFVLTPGADLPAPTGTISYVLDGGSPQTVALAAGRASATVSGLFAGSHTVTVNYSGDANYLPAGPQSLALTVILGTPVINSGGLVGAAGGFISPGGLGTIYGSSLAGVTVSANSLPLPTTLGGIQVLVLDVAAPLLYVSPTQINFQVPQETPSGGRAVRVQLVQNGTPGPSLLVDFPAYAPAVFTIVHADNTPVTADKPARPGEVVVIYATGAGRLNNAPASGAAAPASPLATTKDTPTVTVGGASATVLFSGLTPGFVGLLQINIQLPATLPAGATLPLVITFPGASSAPVNLWVKN